MSPTNDVSLPEVCKAVVLSTAGHRFALPLNAIARIVHRTLLQRDRNLDGLYYLDHQPLNGINLAQLLLSSPGPGTGPGTGPDAASFFVIVQLNQKPAGLAADQPPVLMDLPLQAIYPVPAAYQQQLRGLATHMILLEPPDAEAAAGASSPLQDNLDSIFLLDLQRVARLVKPELAQPLAVL